MLFVATLHPKIIAVWSVASYLWQAKINQQSFSIHFQETRLERQRISSSIHSVNRNLKVRDNVSVLRSLMQGIAFLNSVMTEAIRELS